ncbi:MAG: hypothetical protein KME27_08860 [Lyngbya sp. HA4199-MV5]|nr:hypothetical protein [Lyngbya sp. HA4199-MV5]
MEATTHQQSLQRLAHQLQLGMRSLPADTPIQIQCVVKQGTLMVLGQHPPDDLPHPKAIFDALEEAIQTALPAFKDELALGETAQAKLYLRVLGQRQPYASQSLPLRLSTLEPFSEAETAEDVLESPADELEETDDRADDSEPDEHQGHSDTDPIFSQESLGTTDSIYDSAYVEPSDLAPLDPALEPPVEASTRPARSSLLPWLLAGIGVSIAGFAAGLWVMSRPCVLGVCEPLQAAQILSQKSAQTMQTAKTGQELQQAQQQLAEATRLLQSIPAWSSHHGEAETLQQAYRSQSQTLDQVLAAETKANTAAQISQTLPQPVAGLQSAQSLWREAIAQLQTIPQDNPLHAFAQERLTRYTDRLSAIDTLIKSEQQAQKKLTTARETAKVAEARQGIAQTPENWQLAQTTWQVVINTLQQISNTTTSYAEAQKLLTDYQPKLTAARDRATQEQVAQKAFTQALSLAQRAETAQRQNQWSQAVANWRDALATVKQVPKNTAYTEPAQPLLASYGTSLKQAEAQLQVASAMQRTRADLNRICAGSPRMCTYTIANDVVRVQFTGAYERKLRTAYVLGQSGDRGTLGGVINHIETLQTALQAIADNAGMPLEVYSADGSELIGSFNPKG